LKLSEGAKGVDDCPALIEEKRQALEDYMGRFDFSD